VYIVHAYSNFEKKVAESSANRPRARAGGLLSEILVRPRTWSRSDAAVRSSRAEFLSRYVLVKMDLIDEAYHLITRTPRR